MGLREHPTSKLFRRDSIRLGPRRTPVAGWAVISVLTIVLALIIRAFVFQTFRIPSDSMAPTLEAGDHIVVSKLSYGSYAPGSAKRIFGSRMPVRGDVVVFYRFSEFEDIDEDVHYVKRIVALPGETVEVREGKAYVNGVESVAPSGAGSAWLSQEEIAEFSLRNYGPVTLAEDEYFVIGDNRSNSKDSRFYGPIHFHDIVGRAVLVYWSWGSPGALGIRWRRLGRLIR